MGICFLPLGIGLYITSQGVNELVIDYTNCDSNGTFAPPVTSWNFDMSSSRCTINVRENPIHHAALADSVCFHRVLSSSTCQAILLGPFMCTIA